MDLGTSRDGRYVFGLQSAKHAKEELVKGYRYRFDTEKGGYEEVDWLHLEVASGAGAVISNVLDYVKWGRSLIDKDTPLSKAGFEALFMPRTLMPIEEPYTGPRAYALGWRTGVYRGQRVFKHSGGLPGFGAELLIFPDIKFAVVALANTAGTANFVDQKLAYHLIDGKLDVPVERFDWDKE
jgi:CubicO group peptidase (beta-lactamase class C family)